MEDFIEALNQYYEEKGKEYTFILQEEIVPDPSFPIYKTFIMKVFKKMDNTLFLNVVHQFTTRVETQKELNEAKRKLSIEVMKSILDVYDFDK